MQHIQWDKAFIAFIVILCFVFVGFAIGMRNFWLAGLFFLLGLGTMGYGIAKTRRKDGQT
ncbi:DUF5325 family protein [Thalassobacillus pellis]|uniref:DUF5325 family protein n=1 Tax=Thalassobacillus pellis TaxID=748008 RepID=UPI00195F8881|nr:DUF5325 family protein [Thalassobacillus pellis]MBM7552906.1 hypothetical protein [Thalassobacillus pellis]